MVKAYALTRRNILTEKSQDYYGLGSFSRKEEVE
nr:MAG TPA: hypothetical protein [Caudoviricetes sp.]